MKLHFETSSRTAGTRRMLIGLAAVTGLVCGAGGALAQGQRARSTPAAPPSAPAAPAAPSAPAAPPAPPAPSPLSHRVFSIGSGPASYIFKSNENGREIELRLENNEIVSAKIDGTELPKDQVTRAGDTIFFKDANGATMFEHVVAQPREARFAVTRDPFGSLNAAPMHPRSRAGQVWSGAIPNPDAIVAIEAEPPNVMLGVTMMEPDASLRGHLGLEPSTSTLVGAVYAGLPGDAAGLEPYDIIIAINGQKPADTGTLRKALREKEPGAHVTFTVIHRGKEREATIKLEKYDRSRFDETKVKSIAAVGGDEALRYTDAFRLYGQRLTDMVGVAPDANNPAGTLFVSPDIGAERADLQRLIEGARAQAEEQSVRAHELMDRLNAKSSDAKGLEERMRRLEELLQKLLDDRSGAMCGGGACGRPGSEPSPGRNWSPENPSA